MGMTFQQLQAALAIVDGQVTASAATITTANFAEFLRLYYGGNSIVITGATPGPGSGENGIVVIDGYSSYLQASNVSVRAWFALADDGNTVAAGVRYTLRGSVPSTTDWTPAVSFPSMPENYNVTIRQNRPQQPALATFALFNTYFIVCTGPGSVPGATVPLVTGINFVTDASASGTLAIIASLVTGIDTITLYGPVVEPSPAIVQPPLQRGQYPWTLPAPPPGMTLTAILGSGFSIGTAMTFSAPAFHLYTPLDTTWLASNPTYAPVMAFTGVLTIPSANVTVNLLSEFMLGFPKIVLTGTLSGATVSSLSNLVDLSGSSQLAQILPAAIQSQLGKIELQDVTVCFAPSSAGFGVRYAFFTVGLPGVQWNVIPDYVEVSAMAAEFMVYAPFDSKTRSISVSLSGDVSIVDVELEVATDFPGFLVTAQLLAPVSIPFSNLTKEYFPALTPPTDLTINQLYLRADPGTSYSVSTIMAQTPAWVIPVGAHTLTISNVSFTFTATTGQPTAGTFAGLIGFDAAAVISVQYTVPGDFFIRGDFGRVTFTQLLSRLVNQPVDLPDKFDLTFLNSSVVIEKTGADYVFLLGTQVEKLGSFAIQVQQVGNLWGFAAGLVFQSGKLSEIPGLASLAPFETNFQLNKLLLVVSSITSPQFQFPDLSVFHDPNIVAKKITLPAQSNGLIAGINAFAEIKIGGSAQQNLLANFLGLKTATLGATLQIGANPARNARIAVSITATFSGGTLTAQLGAKLPFELFLIGTYRTIIQEQAVQFDVAIVFVENGAFLSGTMKGGPVKFGALQLANAALEVGIDAEGIPSVGVAATIAVPGVEGSVAVFFDSAEPSKSMVAGAVSDVTLKTIVDALAGSSVPSSLDALLASIGVEGTGEFHIPVQTAAALNNLDIATVSTAFQNAGVTIPSNSAEVLLIRDEAGTAWYLTDLTRMFWYELKQEASDIVVAKEAQLYLAPQATSIGTITFPQGFHISGRIKFLGIEAFVDVQIDTGSGISADAGLTPIVIFNENFFRITGVGNQGGPLLSFATFRQPTKPPQFQPPHFFLSAEVRFLGVVGAGVFIDISTSGAAFKLDGELVPGTHYALNGTFASLSSFGIGGSASVGVNTTINLGILGSVPIDVQIAAAIGAAYQNRKATAFVSGAFEFQRRRWTIIAFQLDVKSQDLANLPALFATRITSLFTDFLKSPVAWLKWIADGVITGLTGGAEEIGRILSTVFGLSPLEIARLVQQYLRFGLDQIIDALIGAGQTAQEIAQILEDLGEWTIEQITDAIAAIFGGHADVDLHIDNVVQQHLDQPGTGHQDIAGTHQDTPGTHQDTPATHQDTAGTSHQDTPGPHQDTPATHQDTPGTHQDDQGVHQDTTHTDQSTGSHIDNTIPCVNHQDQAPPHTDIPHDDDTTSHIDTNPVQHIDDNPTQHIDSTTSHIDNPGSSHIDNPTQHQDTPAHGDNT